MTKLLLTESDVAAQLGISKATLGRIRRGGGIAFRGIGSRIRYTQADVDEYIETSRHRAPVVPRPASTPSPRRGRPWNFNGYELDAEALALATQGAIEGTFGKRKQRRPGKSGK